MPLNKDIRKVLVIGSGPIVIGQAAEFDYAGAQACHVLKEAGVNVVLVNSNPATIMTDNALADEIYLEPLTVDTIKRIIEKEKPDSLLAGLGGQTGLTLAMQLSHEGFLQEHNVRLLGTDAKAIDKAEDRQLFKDTMEEIGQPCIPSDIANDIDSALMIAANQGHVVEGMLMLLVYSLGLGIPLFISALLIDRLKGTFSFIKKHYNVINIVSGVLLVVVGLLMATGLFSKLLSMLA